MFPARWENPRSGKAGYAPVCRNEWVPGLCGKPRVKCGACPNQAFVAVTDTVIRDHLLGRREADGTAFTVGVYPMLADDTCWFVPSTSTRAPGCAMSRRCARRPDA